MIVDPRWYECFMAALTGLSSSMGSNPSGAAAIPKRARAVADDAYEVLLEREAKLAAERPKEIQQGQVWRLKEDGPTRVVSSINGDAVHMRSVENGPSAAWHAKKMLASKDCFLVGQEPVVSTSENKGIVTAEDGAASTPEGEQGQSS